MNMHRFGMNIIQLMGTFLFCPTSREIKLTFPIHILPAYLKKNNLLRKGTTITLLSKVACRSAVVLKQFERALAILAAFIGNY